VNWVGIVQFDREKACFKKKDACGKGLSGKEGEKVEKNLV
jgi:hypothetical protein